MKEVLQQANDYVQKVEFDHAKAMFDELATAKIQSINCGCPSCRKTVLGIQESIRDEAIRLYPVYPYDEEEEWIERNGLQ